MKTKEEIIEKLKERIHRARRKFLYRHLKPCMMNCVYKTDTDLGPKCIGCSSTDPNQCKSPRVFEPVYTKEWLYNQFKQWIRNPEVLLREYKDIATLLWVLGQFDTKEQFKDNKEVVSNYEKRIDDKVER